MHSRKFLLLTCAFLSCNSISLTPVLAAQTQTTSQTSMIDNLTQQIRQTESYKKDDSSMLGDVVNQVTQVENSIEEQKQKELEEKQELSSLGFKTDIDQLTTEPQSICSNPTSEVKTYMDGSKVTNTASAQYKLLQTMHVNEQGFYITDDGFIGVALGSYYGPIGSKFLVTLENGNTFKVIKADAKADIHVYNGCYHKQDGSMMEFIIDTATAGNYWGVSNGYVAGGNFNNIEQFKGKIVSMERVL